MQFGINADTVNRKQLSKVIDALLRTASQEDSLDVKAASPTAGGSIAQIAEQELARPNGLQRIAFAMHQVLKRRLDYHAIGRQNLLVVDEITTGDLPYYDLDLAEYSAVTTAGRGEPIRVIAAPKRVQVPTISYSAVQQVHYEDITIRRYPLFDRAKERVAIAIAIAEDDAIFGPNGVVETAATKGPNGIVSGHNLNRYILAELWGKIADKQLNVGSYIMHPVQYKEILKWSGNEADQVTLNKIIETGQIGSINGVKLLMSNRVSKTAVYAATTSDKLGRLAERKSVEVKVLDQVLELYFAILAWQQIGLIIFNTAGVAKASVDSSI